MSVAKFVSLLTSGTLYFSPVSGLEDRFEGRLPVESPNRPLGDEVDLAHRRDLQPFARAVRALTKVCCWHEEGIESDALWRLYADKTEAVAIKTSLGTLRDLLGSFPSATTISRVHYVEVETFAWPPKPGSGSHPYLYKRNCFQHEREVRAVLLPDITTELLESETPVSDTMGTPVQVDLAGLIH
jgi:hypothetical protein